MNYKLFGIYIAFGLIISLFTACEKENLDQMRVDEEEVNTEVVLCDSWQLAISHDGSGNLAPTMDGGMAPYSFNWSTGDTEEMIKVPEGGTYGLTVTDAAGCTVASDITFTVPACDSLLVYFVQVTTGTFKAVAGFGIMPYTYLWNTGDTTQSLTFVTDGTYAVTVTDAFGCTGSFEIDYEVPGPCDNYVATIAEVPVGTLIALAIGGMAPIDYEWSTGQSGSSIIVASAGTYYVTITDANGCVATAEEISPGADACNGFDITISNPQDYTLETLTTAGTAPFSYYWSTGEETSSIDAPGPGDYSVTITDDSGCKAMDDFQL